MDGSSTPEVPKNKGIQIVVYNPDEFSDLAVRFDENPNIPALTYKISETPLDGRLLKAEATSLVLARDGDDLRFSLDSEISLGPLGQSAFASGSFTPEQLRLYQEPLSKRGVPYANMKVAYDPEMKRALTIDRFLKGRLKLPQAHHPTYPLPLPRFLSWTDFYSNLFRFNKSTFNMRSILQGIPPARPSFKFIMVSVPYGGLFDPFGRKIQEYARGYSIGLDLLYAAHQELVPAKTITLSLK